MDEATNQNWRKELSKWLTERQVQSIATRCLHPVARPVLEVLAQARQTVAGISATAAGVKVLDLNKYDHLASILEEVLALDSFSLAEYTYSLPGDKHPGMRLWYDASGASPRITVLLFEDVHQWRVDNSGKKVSWQTLHLGLLGDQPSPDFPEGAERLFSPGRGWRDALIDALCLPVRLFRNSYPPSFRQKTIGSA